MASVVGIGLNYAASEAEIYRAGILSVPAGQWHAAFALGLARMSALRLIIMPQAVRLILPLRICGFRVFGSPVAQLRVATDLGRTMELPEDFQFDFKQKRVLVTGAGKGIGREIATMLHRSNAQVIALSRTEKDLQSLKEEIGCETILAELADPDAAKRAAEQAGNVDLLVNNAAIAILEPFLKVTVNAWDKTMAVNLRAVMIISQVIARQMIERGVAGSIVNVSSMASFQAVPDHAAYCATKAGLDQLTAVMAVELGQHKIRVNSVNPTVVLTVMGKRAWSDPAKGGPMLARIPLRRFAECQDIASVVCFLLTGGAAMLNGLALRIDGGFLVS